MKVIIDEMCEKPKEWDIPSVKNITIDLNCEHEKLTATFSGLSNQMQ